MLMSGNVRKSAAGGNGLAPGEVGAGGGAGAEPVAGGRAEIRRGEKRECS